KLVHDLIESRKDEIAELDLGNGPQPVHRHADGGADDPGLRERRVDDAIGAELLDQSDRSAKDAAELAHVFAQHDHARIAAHLDLQRVVDRLDDVPRGHVYETQFRTKNSPAL